MTTLPPLPPLPDTPYSLYYEWPDDEDGYGGSEVVDSCGYTAEQMNEYGAACAAAERERCARIVEEYNPGGSYHIRTVLAAAIRAMKEAP